MKRLLTILLSFVLTAALAQQQAQPSTEKPQMLTGITGSVYPIPETLPAPLYLPDGSRATLAFYDDRATFDADFPALPVEGFENATIPDFTAEAVSHPLDALSDNNYFNPGDILPGIQIFATDNNPGNELAVVGHNFMGNSSKTVVINRFVDDYRLLFNPPVASAGMDVQDFLGNGWCTIQIYDGEGMLLGSDVTAASNSGVFWGVASDEPIGEIRIISQGDGAEGADNIAFGNNAPPVPLSGMAIGLGILLILAFAVIRLRRVI